MKILMLNNEFPPLGGGTGTVNQALFRHFAEIPNLEIDLITSSLGESFEEEKFSNNISLFKVPVDNQNIHHSSNTELIRYAHKALTFSLRRCRTKHYDLCFAWSTLPAGAIALALRKITGLSYIIRVSGPDIPGFEKRYSAIYPFLTPIIKASWRRALVVVAKCAGEAKMIEAVNDKVNIELIPNGVELASFHTGERRNKNGHLHLLCVARLIERKGQSTLIEAVSRLKEQKIDVVLDLVGTGDAKSQYQELAKKLGVTDRVRFVGYVPREEIVEYYSAAHVFVLPSYNEGMSVATLEAMAAKLPVVVTNTGGTNVLVNEGVNGYTFNCGDVETLTSHLFRLSCDRELISSLGAASHERAANFSWQKVVKKYLELFNILVGNN